MTQQKLCQDCSQKHDCQEVYQQLGKAEGHSVVSNVVVAFLLPLMVFIAALAAFVPHQFFVKKFWNVKEENWCGISFLLALSVTFALIFIIKAVNKRISKDK